MTPATIPEVPGAEASRADQVLLALLSLRGSATPAELAEATGIPARSLTRALARLAADGFIDGSKTRRRLTAQGFERCRPPRAQGSFDAAVVEVFEPHHAALVRLMADAVALRHLDPERSWHPSFAVCGAPGTGKSSLAEFLCWALGLDPQRHVVMVPSLSPGELLGRRVPEPGGAYRFERAPLTDYPFVCLDEWSQADVAVRRESLRLLDGQPAVVIEGERVALRAVTLVAYNPSGTAGLQAPLPEAYWRRCYVLNTDYASEGRGLASRLRSFYERRPPQALDLARLALPFSELRSAALALITDDEKGFRERLTDAGRTNYGDVRAAEACALGRAARLGLDSDDDPRLVVLGVIHDILSLAETIPGQINPSGWRVPLTEEERGLAGADLLRNAIESHKGQAERIKAEREQKAKAKDVDSLTLIGRRASVAESFRQAAKAIERVPEAARPEATGIRAQLRRLAADAEASRSAGALDKIRDLGSPVAAQAHAMRAKLDDEARRAKDAEAAARAREQRDRRTVAERAKAARARDSENRRKARAEQAERIKQAKPLRDLLARKTTRPGEDVIGKLVALGVLSKARRPYVADSRSQWDKLMGKPERPETFYETVYVVRDGRVWRPAAFDSWQAAATRAALQAAIDHVDRPGPLTSGVPLQLSRALAAPAQARHGVAEPGDTLAMAKNRELARKLKHP